MSRHLAFDITRLFIGPMSPTPRGIDRVDLAYMRHFFQKWPGDCVGVLPTPWGIRWYNRDRALRVVDFIEQYWGESDEPDVGLSYQWVKSRLKGERPTIAPPNRRPAAQELARGFARFARQHGLAWGHRINSLPSGAVYLNTGQITLAIPRLLKWLGTRKDIKAVFMLHDAIPLEYPEYCSARSRQLYTQMVVNAVRYGASFITTTVAAGESIRRVLPSIERSNLAMLSAHLPVPTPFLKPTAPDPELDGIKYFVASGPIEPRKNHLLLLNVWRQLVREDREKAPKLVLVGSRIRTNKAVVDMLDKCEIIQDHVVEIGGLSTPALRQLLSGACALLMPSFAEGFGIPIIEALALGRPVIASDLATHREAGGECVTYLSVIDGLGWLNAVRHHAADAANEIAQRLARSYKPLTWTDYFQRVEQFIFAESEGSISDQMNHANGSKAD